MTANSAAMLAAEKLGAKPSASGPPVPIAPPEMSPAGAIAALLKSTLDFQAGLSHEQSKRMDGIAVEVAKSSLQFARLVEVMRGRKEAATAGEISQLIGALGESINAKISIIDGRVGRIEALMTALLDVQQATLLAQYDPVVPRYDNAGKLIEARRQKSD